MALKSRETLILISIFLAFGLFLTFDVMDDIQGGVHWSHLVYEIGMLIAICAGVVILWWSRVRLKKQMYLLNSDLARTQELYEKEKAMLSEGLIKVLDQNFEKWHFSPAEKEVALLILKGLSLQEIANIRSTSERTVRQQAQSIYSKSNLAGRAEFSAYFLEDLL